MTKLTNSKCDKTLKLKILQNQQLRNEKLKKSFKKIGITKKTQIVTNLISLNSEKNHEPNFLEQTEKLKLLQNSKTK